ncbi:hypothetical protein NP233_g2413 [Leucocoprinus birnbaumii]|uniref:F-box domain-containing protein n=1 Tax=Leucocoprinus birnbaumii TaxID=56174 RepID=A0AAD5W2B8_9AGAR|nr:hypothetical protein NP233_g2413 [Leucocoprinus birnbaumii]
MPLTFDDIPEEVLIKIIEYIPIDTKFRSLRLVSKRFNDTITPILFSTFKIYMRNSPGLRCDSLIAALTDKNASVFTNLKNLKVFISPTYSGSDRKPWFNLLSMLLNVASDVYCVSWTHRLPNARLTGDQLDKSYPHHAIERFTQSLGALPNFKELHVDICPQSEEDPNPNFPLEPIAGLRVLEFVWSDYQRLDKSILSQISRLLARSPEIEAFSFRVYPGPKNEGLRLEEIFDATLGLSLDLKLKALEVRGVVVDESTWRKCVRHFHYLERLTVREDPSPIATSNIGGVFRMLSKEQIHLKEIHIDALNHDGVMDYMTSFSGLEKLFMRPDHPLDDSLDLVHRFFTAALPCHKQSLKLLKIGGNSTTAWSKILTTEQWNHLAACTQLEHLRCWVSITSEEVALGCSDTLNAWLETSIRLPKLRLFECPYVSVNGPYTSQLRGSDLLVNELVKKTVEAFIRRNHISFDIDAKSDYSKLI